MKDYRPDDGRTTFHYRRSDRLAARGLDENGCDDKARPKKRSRSFVIILIDVVLILVIYAVITTFFIPRSGRARIGGVQVELLVQSLGDENRYVVRIVAPRTAGPDRPPLLVSVVFYEGQDAVSDEILDVLPERPGAERIIDIVRPVVPADTRVRAVVRLDDDEVILEAPR
jgi:hypothetical protein